MRVLIHDTLATAPFTYPLAAGWVASDPALPVAVRDELRGGDLGVEDVALAPAAEVAAAQKTHVVAPDVAVVTERTGAVALRTPVRPDEVERGPVRLWGTSGAGEALARATLRPFYGIEPTEWIAGEEERAAQAQAVVVEGAEALRRPEAGFAEDLVRAWFILTGLPVVSHVLLVPAELDRAALRPALAFLAALAAVGHERRRDLRRAVAAAHALDLDRLVPVLAAQRLTLEGADRRALATVLERGLRGSAYPPLAEPRFLEPETPAD